ncbi:hypothetical protein GE061_001267 [Apolygus lucorum]|uniref:Uncharacterized protein n=1 Tax=Apolygus lucorum TaxID=248454 RepID=A0A8S9YA70_APOLU|nr:hypothetical protein GE061_001267 [Apolygus lucorum]
MKKLTRGFSQALARVSIDAQYANKKFARPNNGIHCLIQLVRSDTRHEDLTQCPLIASPRLGWLGKCGSRGRPSVARTYVLDTVSSTVQTRSEDGRNQPNG